MRGAVLAALAIAAVLGTSHRAAAADDVIATVGDTKITKSQVEDHVRAQLIAVENQRYEAMKDGLDGMIADALLAQEAKKQGTTAEALEKKEIDDKVGEPTDAEIQKVYDDNKAQLGGQTLEQVKPRIVQYLKQQKEAARRTAYLDELRKKYPTTVSLRPPVVQVDAAGRPERGPAKAPVTIITFSDYECPYCKRAEATVAEVVKAYPTQVKVVFRDYPLPFHQHARGAAEAANCANAQGKFWEYHDKLFASQPALDQDKLKSYAGELGLDQKKFDECLDKKPYKAAIDKDMADGQKVGVNGTPAFFINGRMISGAQPFDKFKQIIDDELAAAKPS